MWGGSGVRSVEKGYIGVELMLHQHLLQRQLAWGARGRVMVQKTSDSRHPCRPGNQDGTRQITDKPAVKRITFTYATTRKKKALSNGSLPVCIRTSRTRTKINKRSGTHPQRKNETCLDKTWGSCKVLFSIFCRCF